MPELVTIETEKYDFVVWSKDVSRNQKRLEKTLAARGGEVSFSRIFLTPAVWLKGESEEVSEYDVGQPVFFENKQYDIEFVFHKSLKECFFHNPPIIEHRLRSVEEAFHYSTRSNSLRATVNTGNDIGWFRFELVYQIEEKQLRQAFSFEVLPTKIDMTTDLQVMNDAIDELFPLWRFSLAERTQQQMQAVKKPNPNFLLLWLAQFESLLEELQSGLRHIVNAPHSRLMSSELTVKMDRLKGRLSRKLEQNVILAKADGKLDKRFKLNNKVLSVDTPENRFIKSVISTSIAKLSKINNTLTKGQVDPDKQRLSDSFFKKLEQWQAYMRFFQRQPLFREVGSFNGLRRESLVLQQKPGYAKVYKIWQQLKCYLDLLEGDSNLSLKSVSELYEIWCFLEVRRILLSLEFNDVSNARIPMVNTGVEVSFKDGMQGAFILERDDGIKLRLAHEPKFMPGGTKIKSWLTTQEPDIFLEATFPDGEKIVWLFDAKYRIKNPEDFRKKNTSDNDYVPDDALNQMHRYRDALIRLENKNHEDVLKTRPVFGAYALYPGFYDQINERNPYSGAIDDVGIGAFSLLPAKDNSGSVWLTEFLTEILARKEAKYGKASTDKYFVEEAPRIPYHGTQVSRFDDLVIATNQLGPFRDAEYIDQFKLGEAGFYHTKQIAFQRLSIEHHVVREARYLAVAVDAESGGREVRFLYPILHAEKVRRDEISREQSGTATISDPDEIYWLFGLGKSLRLKNDVVLQADSHFHLKLVGREDLSNIKEWNALHERYSSMLL